MKLDLTPKKIELVYEDADINAANFDLPAPDSYFCNQACVYREDGKELDAPYFELNEQSNLHFGDVAAVVFFARKSC